MNLYSLDALVHQVHFCLQHLNFYSLLKNCPLLVQYYSQHVQYVNNLRYV